MSSIKVFCEPSVPSDILENWERGVMHESWIEIFEKRRKSKNWWWIGNVCISEELRRYETYRADNSDCIFSEKIFRFIQSSIPLALYREIRSEVASASLCRQFDSRRIVRSEWSCRRHFRISRSLAERVRETRTQSELIWIWQCSDASN